MSENTKGLLALFRNGQSVGSADGTGVCEVWPRDENSFPDSEGKANARRIVACWNLLDGYATEELEGVTLAEFVAKQAFISQFDANDGINLSISGVAVQLLAASFAGQFKASGATNYLELSGNHPETGPFTITMQRKHGLSPAEKLVAMTKQRDVLLEALNGVLGVMNNSQGVAGWHKNGAIATWDELLPEVAAALEFAEGEQS
ncbi:hypothetical protein E4630_16410 [Aeromonas hydrophila]|uniref:hypothetical protein n=1 Tax=Aeromonas hydrophila TaxID=644 RepID=UPI000FD17DD0|nr:hypothetical protein [Aeromonas hydrophila]AZU47903.1 hypothetical protein C3B79_2132 [Aeromonas hydrophila]QBX72297.1 hypothetical protein E4625_16635 [Aeromonas hydrophila]QBX76997.1 hypothetical protein E4630_16410 [Aeromonas hydrophila]